MTIKNLIHTLFNCEQATEQFLATDSEPVKMVPSTSLVAVPLTQCSRSAVVHDARKWAGKRKPRPCIAEHRSVATDNISALAAHQMTYYTEKLAMERAEHKIRMEVLEMERELMMKRLAAFGEE